MTEIVDKSLLRCTIKKSADVTSKLVLVISKIVVGLTAATIGLVGACGVWSVIATPLANIVTLVVSLLFAIPWYFYGGALTLLAIPMYSLIWCIARELTDEDWSSGEAKDIAGAIAVAGAGTVAGAHGSKLCLFIGAYLHYRKRMR